MAKYRIDSIANLVRQMAFTPAHTRLGQIAAAESLLPEIDPAKAYPIEFVVYRITGYQPKTDRQSSLLTGLALQHDLGLLIEQVSESLKLTVADAAEPVLSIDDVTERFDVTSKTIQRWRRRGLPARRFEFADGKRRVGFLLSSVERFIAGQSGSFDAPAARPIETDEQTAIITFARRLAPTCSIDAAAVRIGRRLKRSPLAVLHTLKSFDATNPGEVVLPTMRPMMSAAVAVRVVRGFRKGRSLRRLARRVGVSPAEAYRVVMADRIERVTRRKMRFVDDVLYHDADAESLIDDMASQPNWPDGTAVEGRVPKDLPPAIKELCRAPLLSPASERALFLQLNFRKYQFESARRKLEPELARSRDIARLEQCLAKVTESKNGIIRANLRLVVSVARRHVRPGVGLMELVSEGSLTLMRAVDAFDPHRGFKFSTYATLALMKGFARSAPALAAARPAGGADRLVAVADPRGCRAVAERLDREHVGHLLSTLDDREQKVLQARFGLGADSPATVGQIARDIGITPDRVRKIEQSALAKLRATAD